MNWSARRRNHKRRKKDPEKTAGRLICAEIKRRGLAWALQNQREMHELSKMFSSANRLELFKFIALSRTLEQKLLFLMEKKHATK